MAIDKVSYQNGTLSRKELRALIKEREKENKDRVEFRPIYIAGFIITAVISFFACWIYAFVEWGFLLGVGLGWIPSIFIAVIAGFIWPLLALVLVVGLVVGLCIIGFLFIQSI